MASVETCYEEKSKQMFIKKKREEQSTYTTIVLIGTLILTTLATVVNCFSLLTNYWEHITWDSRTVMKISYEQNMGVKSHLDNQITRVSVTNSKNSTVDIYLLPMHGGIWTICFALNGTVEEETIPQNGFPVTSEICVNYLSTKLFKEESYYHNADWNYRMQNVTISCALVSLIILGCAALTGAFGIFKHQLSAILVTGIMYLLAGTFALFTIMIAHFKRLDCRRNHIKSNGINVNNRYTIFDEGILVESVNKEMLSEFGHKFNVFYNARELTLGWSYDVAMIGVLFSVITSIMWILLAKILRYSPLSMQL